MLTKRPNQTKLVLNRRHMATCKKTRKLSAATLDQCECPFQIHGRVRGEYIRQALDTRSLEVASRRKQQWEAEGSPQQRTRDEAAAEVTEQTKEGRTTFEFAAKTFLEAKAARALSTVTLYTRALQHFGAFCERNGLERLRDIEPVHVQRYFNEHGKAWEYRTAKGRLIHLRVFFNYCIESRWLTLTPAIRSTNVGPAALSAKTRNPFKPDEIKKLLEAVENMPDADRDRTRALVMLLLYSGMRISDATFCERASVNAKHELDYFVIKTRRRIALPIELQQPAIDALSKLPASRIYFFQPDRADDYTDARRALRNGAEFSQHMPGYKTRIQEATRLVLEVLALAGLPGACHRFRDTFAINLLNGGTDIYTVSRALGHSAVKITEDHYLKLVDGYRQRMSQATRVLTYPLPQQQ